MNAARASNKTSRRDIVAVERVKLQAANCVIYRNRAPTRLMSRRIMIKDSDFAHILRPKLTPCFTEHWRNRSDLISQLHDWHGVIAIERPSRQARSIGIARCGEIHPIRGYDVRQMMIVGCPR